MADWRKGDLALCVNDAPNPWYGPCSVKKGRVYTVEAVGAELPCTVTGPCAALFLKGHRSASPEGLSSLRFRKVTPPKADEFDREVIELMNGQPAEYSGKSPMRTSWWEAVS